MGNMKDTLSISTNKIPYRQSAKIKQNNVTLFLDHHEREWFFLFI